MTDPERRRLNRAHQHATRQAGDLAKMWHRAWPHLYEDDRPQDDIVVTTNSMRSRPLHTVDPPHLRRYLKAACHLAAADRELAKLHHQPHWHSDLPKPNRAAHSTPRHPRVLEAASLLVEAALDAINPNHLDDADWPTLEHAHNEIAEAMRSMPEPGKSKPKPLRCTEPACNRKRDGRHKRCKHHRDPTRRAA